MAILTPSASDSLFPSFPGYDADTAYDVSGGVLASLEDEYFDAVLSAQIMSEILKHQALLAIQNEPTGTWKVKLSDAAGAYAFQVTDSSDTVLFSVASDGTVTLSSGLIGVPQIFNPQSIGTPSANAATLTELNGAEVLQFADGATESVLLNAEVQDTSTTIELVWSTPAASGNGKFQMSYRTTSDGDAMNGAWTTSTVTDSAGPYAHSQITTQIELTGLTVGETILMKIDRLGGDVADTLGDVVNLARIVLLPV